MKTQLLKKLFQFILITTAMFFFYACHAIVNVLGLSGNETSCDNTNQALAIDANSEIFGGTWDSSAALRSVFGGAFSGLWPSSVDKYLGVRLVTDTNSYYGWIRL